MPPVDEGFVTAAHGFPAGFHHVGYKAICHWRLLGGSCHVGAFQLNPGISLCTTAAHRDSVIKSAQFVHDDPEAEAEASCQEPGGTRTIHLHTGLLASRTIQRMDKSRTFVHT